MRQPSLRLETTRACSACYSNCAVSRKVTGAATLETLPGLKRQRRKLLRAASSRWRFPVLFHMETWVTLPLSGSIVIIATPSPVIPFCRATGGYSGHGALKARALAEDERCDPAVARRTFAIGLLTFCGTGGGLCWASVNKYSSTGVGTGTGGSLSGGTGSSRDTVISTETSTGPVESAPIVSIGC